MSEFGTVCLIEDDAIMGESLTDRLALEGLGCDWYRDGTSALSALGKRDYAAIVSDIRLPDLDGEALFKSLLDGPRAVPPTVFITGFGSIDQAVRLLHLGARDYITKPFDLDHLLDKLRTVCPAVFSNDGWIQREAVLGVSPALRRLQDLLARAAEHSARVLITGESGVGKEHAARFLHACTDPDGRRPFQAVNCAAIQESLLEAELFGYERGAFTGAVRAHRGVFERAHEGTLFLDEIGDMPLPMQAKLLRVIQDGRIERLGSERPLDVRVQLVCATNQDIEALVSEGKFREDLFYRVNVVNVHIPPLRERPEDILWFTRKFLERCRIERGIKRVLSPACERFLQTQPWPGNVRELEYAIERASIFARDTLIEPADLGDQKEEGAADTETGEDLRDFLQHSERGHILRALEGHGWRIQETSQALGVSRKSLWEKMQRYRINRDDAS